MFHVWGKHHGYVYHSSCSDPTLWQCQTLWECHWSRMQQPHKLEEFPFRNALLQQFLGASNIWTMHAFPIQMHRSFNSFPVLQYFGIKQCTCLLLEVAVSEEGSEFRIKKKHLDNSCAMNLTCLHALNVENYSSPIVRWIRNKCKFYPSIWKRKN